MSQIPLDCSCGGGSVWCSLPCVLTTRSMSSPTSSSWMKRGCLAWHGKLRSNANVEAPSSLCRMWAFQVLIGFVQAGSCSCRRTLSGTSGSGTWTQGNSSRQPQPTTSARFSGSSSLGAMRSSTTTKGPMRSSKSLVQWSTNWQLTQPGSPCWMQLFMQAGVLKRLVFRRIGRTRGRLFWSTPATGRPFRPRWSNSSCRTC